ncbi:MAG: amidohydrolase family protein [Gemmatimonadetes bacterium]|nr:amidohydrolase family protein [Gemmatimonadota bacterium]
MSPIIRILPSLRRAALVCALPFILIPSAAATQERYDVVLQGGRVMDPETGLDAIRNVGIRGQTVVAISAAALSGDVVVDVSGMVVAPGFIDLHAHGQTNRANEFQAMDGVTTALELEGGMPDVASYLKGRRGNSVLNFGATMSHGAARMWVMPNYAPEVAQVKALLKELTTREPTLEEMLTMGTALDASRYDALEKDQYPALRARLREGLAEGAIGIGMPHQYYPGANRDEIYRVFEMAGNEQIPIYTHVRSMGIDAMQEVIANAVATGAPLHIVHVNSMSLWDIQTNLDLITGAQAAGVDVTTEAYPYTAASTTIGSTIFDEGWQERLQISYGDLQWQETGERLTEATFNEFRARDGVIIIHLMKPEWISSAMSAPNVMVASDGMPYAPGAHPRSAGTFARFLGKYVRDEGVLTLMEGLRKITLMPAQRLETISPQMHRKGRLQIGSDADVTVFDPARIIDTATFDGDLTYSEGVKFMLVNGQFVVRDGEVVTGARPGQAVVGRLVVF